MSLPLWPRRLGPFVLALLALGLGTTSVRAAVPTAPAGFTVERVTADGGVTFPMFAAFDDRGRLFVTESDGGDLYAELLALKKSCKIRMLEDRDGDGTFERSSVFAEGLVMPMGITWHDGRLYAADPPDLVALEDTDGDGRADRRTVVLTGFGHTDNGSLHGLTFGPDGLLYMTMGRPDGYTFTRPDGSVLKGKRGALLRAHADGSGIEVLDRGFENLVEISFLPTGEIIGTDNWFQLPSSGVRDAIMHLVPDGVYPRFPTDPDASPYLFTGEMLPAISKFPAVALSGMVRYRGPGFPTEMQDNLFIAQHNTRKVSRHKLTRAGSTFSSEDLEFLASDDPDFHPSDVLEDADGSLLVVDTGSWYVHHCPSGRIRHSPAPGGIYRVRQTAAAKAADPRGLKIDWRGSSTALTALLGDSRAEVRDHAADALRGRGSAAAPALIEALHAPAAASIARQTLLWLLGTAGSPAAKSALAGVLTSRDGAEVAIAARVLSRHPDPQARGQLVKLLRHPRPDVRLAAAEGLEPVADRSVLGATIKALTAKPDAFIEHNLARVVYHAATTADLQKALGHPHPMVQKVALTLLDQAPHKKLGADDVLARMTSPDAALRRTALRILAEHPEWSARAVEPVRKLLRSKTLSAEQEATLHEIVGAFSTKPEMAALVAESLKAPTAAVADKQRIALLDIVSQAKAADLPPAWQDALGSTLAHPAAAVRAQTVRTISVLQLSRLDPQLLRMADAPTESPQLRVDALRALVRRHPVLSDAALRLLLGQIERERPALERSAAMDVIVLAHLPPSSVNQVLRIGRGDPIFSPPAVLALALRTPPSAETTNALFDFLKEGIRLGWLLPAPDMERLRKSLPTADRARFEPLLRQLSPTNEDRIKQIASYEPLLGSGQPAKGEALFYGKVACGACHRVGLQGGTVGPDLTKVGVIRSGRDILESIVVPSATFAQNFDVWAVQTKQGDVFTGIRIKDNDETLILKDATGAELRFRKDQITTLLRSPTSLMPEGLLSALTQEEVKDLLAFLQSLK